MLRILSSGRTFFADAYDEEVNHFFMTALFGKAGLSIAFVIVGVLGGQFLQSKVFAPRPVKSVEIDYNQVRKIFTEEISSLPEPTVKVQTFECEKIKGLREFNYSPQYTGNIAVNGVDSSAVRRWIEQSIMKALEKHVKKIKAEFVPGAVTSPGVLLVQDWDHLVNDWPIGPGKYCIDPGLDFPDSLKQE